MATTGPTGQVSDLKEHGLGAVADGRWDVGSRALLEVLEQTDDADAWAGLGRAQWWMGQPQESLRSRERAFSAYRRAGALGTAAMQAVDIAVCWLIDFGNTSAANGWLSRAGRVAPPDEPMIQGWLTLMAAYLESDPATRVELLGRAQECGREHGDVDLELVAMCDLGVALVEQGDPDRGLALLDEGLAGTIAGEYSRLETVVWNTCSMLAVCAVTGDLSRATEWVAAADRFTERFGCPFLQGQCRLHYGDVLVATGRWALAETELREAIRLSAITGRTATGAVAALVELHLRRGELDAAAEVAEQLDPESAGETIARLDLACGRPGPGIALLRDRLRKAPAPDPRRARAAADLVDALLRVDDVAAAREVVADMRAPITVPGFPQEAAFGARAAAQVAAATGNAREARSRYEEALSRFAELDLPFEAARTRIDLARLLSSQHDPLAVVQARSAYEACTRLGATQEAARAAALLREAGGRVPAGPRVADTLTTREREVLDLVELGLTNPQIAARLYLSRKTVAHHVSRVLAKLGLSSRAEAAAWSARSRR